MHNPNGSFRKLNVTSVAELALLIPKGYEDHRLLPKLIPESFMTIDATIEKITKTPSSLQLDLYAHNFAHPLKGVLFYPKPYMLHQFQTGMRTYLYGKVDCKNGICAIHMPKIVPPSLVGGITPVYKTKLRTDAMRRLVEKILSLEALTAEGLPKPVAHTLLELHFPSLPITRQNDKHLYALKFTVAFVHLQKLRKKRTDFPSLSKHARNIDEWIATLPFVLTDAQQNAIAQIRTDLKSGKAARRMIVGDVGSGKTMVILAAAAMNAPYRSVLMAPTTILASQLYEEAQKFLPTLRTTLVTNKTKKGSLEDFDFIIGTHALLYRDLPEATLVMVDEQHRFGTKQRHLLEKIFENKKKRPHYLQFSATPIPRTQAMIESSYIDVTLITQTPFKKEIVSKVIQKHDFTKLLAHIKSEIADGRQVLIVYPLVEESEAIDYHSIEEARGYWEKHFKNVFVTHGKDKEKERVLLEFRERGDILLATTVVEVGISLPRLSTVIIVGAERLGLSTLHQLRGRVSRTGLKGFCFLYTKQKESKRLEAFCKTTSGFDIAQLDLRYRNSGDLLKGEAQSGKQFVWFDLAEDETILEAVKRTLDSAKL